MSKIEVSIIENAPALEIDKILYARQPMLPRTRRERRIVWNLLNYLAAKNFSVVCVFDGGEYVKVSTPKEAMEVIFNLDDARVYVQSNPTVGKHSVLLILGNDVDVITDWSYSVNDPDGFSAAMDKFDAEVYA